VSTAIQSHTSIGVDPASLQSEATLNGETTLQFLDLKAQFATIRDEVMGAIARVMESQHFILGAEVRVLEDEVAALLGAKHAISCASGSDALILAMLAAGIGAGDEVITTPFTFVATAGSIARVGARPVFVDIEADTFNIDPNRIEAAITPRTRAILPVHLFGLPTDLDSILSIAQKRGVAVIEDAAQAIGARYRDRYVGTIGICGCFSFFPSKNLGGAGDGGLLTTENLELADRLRLLRVHGSSQKYHHEILGVNSRLDTLQAAILRVKLDYLPQWTRQRQLHADRYRRLFGEAGLSDRLRVPAVPAPEFMHVYNQFSVRSRERDALRQFLRSRRIPTEIYYPVPLHLQPAFAFLGYSHGQFPQAELASREVIALPIYPELTEPQQRSIVNAISAFYAVAASS
jgi:dTDP-4-amino-4,6-dideoxygalactose transaminase